jgi:HEPN domain-containing protein
MPADAPSADRTVIVGYLDEVGAELVAAKRLADDPPSRFAAFHVQQAAEKLIKAFRLDRGMHAGKDHNLEALVDGLPEGDEWRPKLEPLMPLSAFATTYRYPSPAGKVKSGPPTAELQKWMDLIAELLVEARAELLTKSG